MAITLATCLAPPQIGPGEAMWTRRYDGSAHGPDRVLDVVADRAGAVVAGWTSDENGDADMLLRRYDRGGTIVWTEIVEAGAGQGVFASSVAFLPDGGVVVGGGIDGDPDPDRVDWDPWLRRYHPDLSVAWSRILAGAAAGEDQIVGVASASDGQIAAAGYEMLSDGTVDVRVWIHDLRGELVHVLEHDGPASDNDVAVAAAYFPSGDLVVVGYETVHPVRPPLTDIWISRWTADGVPVWARTIDGPGAGIDRATGVVIEDEDTIIVTGFVCVATRVMDAFVATLDGGGEIRWTRTHDGRDHLADWANDPAVDGDGNVVIAGFEGFRDDGFDVFVRKYDSYGSEVWTHRHRGPVGDDVAAAVATDPDGFIYVVGSELKTIVKSTATGGDPVYDFDGWIRKLAP